MFTDYDARREEEQKHREDLEKEHQMQKAMLAIKEKYGIQPRTQTKKNRAKWEDSAELILKFYKCYDDYTSAHADKPHEEVDHDLSDTLRTITELETVTP